jgi:hypothetical protein
LAQAALVVAGLRQSLDKHAEAHGEGPWTRPKPLTPPGRLGIVRNEGGAEVFKILLGIAASLGDLLMGAVAAMALARSPASAQSATPADAPLPLSYDAAAREVPAVVRKDTCPIQVAAAEDLRPNKQTIGVSMRGGPVTSEGGPWVTDGLMHLKDFGFAVKRAEASAVPEQGLLVKTSLTRAYTWHVGLKLFGMVAMKAQFIGKDGVVIQEKVYRAHGDKTNMWGAASEYVTTLNYGLNNLLRVMASDLADLCKGSQVEAYTYAGPDEQPKGK